MTEVHRAIIKPLITEKSTLQKEMQNQIAFVVDRRANKIEISKAVEQAFNVKVTKVRTINMRGKKRRMGRTSGRQSDWKKAIVTLAPGEHIDFFEGV
ncbi:MAG: 50S ribosomal protein L23 [Deltaproteobacteria bacterium]|nr:50S ribosomal protein L23 [Deltaproteobacteria bacterium]MBW2051724.1 50S ribosomal protein L23 [Deltaproteobacteria bacterium]MBW2140263.1 50S ribosomal protein L23 [Deltaproteobacteria bacterium]MBW2322106.1 50S ribosomal protein L23 [Deltaproteobacteria bacterium]